MKYTQNSEKELFVWQLVDGFGQAPPPKLASMYINKSQGGLFEKLKYIYKDLYHNFLILKLGFGLKKII